MARVSALVQARLPALVLTLAALLALPAAGLAQGAGAALGGEPGEARLLRTPDIEGDTVVFVYAGDIWVVGADGGDARRLTSHEGQELFPKLSPDGRTVAFVGQYSGTWQVHVIPVDGGEPRQLTFYNDVGELPPRGGIDNRILDWTPDGERIVFLAHRSPWDERIARPYSVPAAGGMEEPLPMIEGGGGSLSPDGDRFAYTVMEREFRTWKRHRGGRAQDVWIYDLAGGAAAERITDFPGTDNQPVWVGDTIYFTSDRSFRLNLFGYDTRTGEITQVTDHQDWDVLWPSGGSAAVVYEAGGYLYRFDPATGASRKIPVRLTGDLRSSLPRFVDLAEQIGAAEASARGGQVLFGARGDLFTVATEGGRVRFLTRTDGVREHSPSWSPDGLWVAYLSDETGEYEVYLRPSDGSGRARRLTDDGSTWRFPPVWSPDGERLAFADRDGGLFLLEIPEAARADRDAPALGEGPLRTLGTVTEIARGTDNWLGDLAWSPDSRWLVYGSNDSAGRSRLWAHSVVSGESHPLTSGATNDRSPAFDPEGRYLYFLSDRDWNLTFSGYEFDFFYTEPTRLFVATLDASLRAPLAPGQAPEVPEQGAAATGPEGDGAGGDGGDDAEPMVFDVEGFEERVQAIPGPSGAYRSVSAVAAGPLYLRGQGLATLHLFDLEAEEEKTILEGIQGYDLTGDRQKVVYRRGDQVGQAALQPGQKAEGGWLDLSRLEVKVDPRAEWRQMFDEGWRIVRDWFYDENLHGVDWQGVRQTYGELLPHVGHRSDLDFLFGEMIGELNAGHMYVDSSTDWQVERREGGLLGATLVADPSGYFRIERIFPGEPWHQEFRSPLAEPGVDAREGDLILAIDGVSTRGVDNVYRLLENKGDQVVTLTLAGSPDGEAREVPVHTVTGETTLRYLDWVRDRRQRVDELSGGRIGYIHLPNTAVEGSRELFRGFYEQFDKDALLLDVRYNGGGFIPDRLIALLERPLLSWWVRRDFTPEASPAFYHQGPKAVLINGYSSSGGDAFPYYFRQRGLGPLIGTRTWGGLIGISGNPDLLDGGAISVATFRFLTPEGEWAVENEGVSPDIEVVDRPDLVARGEDPILEAGVAVLLEALEENPPRPLVVPEPPDESRAIPGAMGDGARGDGAP